MKSLKEFLWYKPGDELLESDSEHFDKWKELGLASGTSTTQPVSEPKIDLDVNNDGKVDEEDVSIMAKVVGRRGGRPKKNRGKK